MTLTQQIEQEARQQGVPVPIALAVAERESGMNPRARGAAGEIGLFQVLPSTGAEMGFHNLWAPGENIQAGVRYLARMFARYGDWPTALMAYNAGPGNVDRGTVPTSSVAYAQQVLASAGYGPATGGPVGRPPPFTLEPWTAPRPADGERVPWLLWGLLGLGLLLILTD